MLSINPHLAADSESNILMEVENLVERLYPPKVTKAAYMKGGNSYDQGIKDCKLSYYLPEEYFWQLGEDLPRFVSVFTEDYQYSEHYFAFIYGCLIADIPLGANNSGTKSSIEPVRPVFPIHQLKTLVDAIHDYKQLPNFRTPANDRLYQMNDKNERLMNYAMAVLNSYSKVLVIRIDLGYYKASKHPVTIADVNKHLNKLLKKKDSHCKEFKDLIGYAWVMEQGKKRGYHIHCVFYFNGHKRQKDAYIARHIGYLWQQVTDKNGTFYNCNENKEQYLSVGIGMINAHKPEEVTNSLKAISYLTRPEKIDQYLRAQPKNSRTFGTGQIKSLRGKGTVLPSTL